MNTQALDRNGGVDILIAEDSPTQAQRLQFILEQQGYHNTVAANGREALEIARRIRPALVISDIVMPEMDGYELCRAIKADAGLADTPVILVTTLSDPEDVIRGLECRADNFILKPYDERYLLGRVQYVLLNRQLRTTEQSGMGVEIYFNERKHFITADRLQILNLLLSTYDAAIQRNRELSRAQEDLQRVNRQLAAANEELDAFSFSVSHDLRAPLGTIASLAQLLERFAGQNLGDRARAQIHSIVDGVRRMTRLIDDLLSFARTARQELKKGEVNLDSMFREVAQDLTSQAQDRQLEWRIHSLPIVHGDPAMLRLVVVNFLSNAIKYTRGRDPAMIEVGVESNGADETAIYVRDNGVGFDMTYARRLFGAFQRLHRESEFEGIGVGLANVRRIVNRHGGRTWAEGRLNAGATFYFSLPREPRE
ncbi:MAG TPA: response regulator [Opitutaceae bacterium]